MVLEICISLFLVFYVLLPLLYVVYAVLSVVLHPCPLTNRPYSHNENNAFAFQPSVVAQAYADLRTIFAEITEHRKKSGAYDQEAPEWTFGNQVGPTALDSHLLPLVLRCVEAGNAELVPPELQRWAAAQAKGPVWQKVMHGRPTLWDPSMGPVEDMQEMMSL